MNLETIFWIIYIPSLVFSILFNFALAAYYAEKNYSLTFVLFMIGLGGVGALTPGINTLMAITFAVWAIIDKDN